MLRVKSIGLLNLDSGSMSLRYAMNFTECSPNRLESVIVLIERMLSIPNVTNDVCDSFANLKAI